VPLPTYVTDPNEPAVAFNATVAPPVVIVLPPASRACTVTVAVFPGLATCIVVGDTVMSDNKLGAPTVSVNADDVAVGYPVALNVKVYPSVAVGPRIDRLVNVATPDASVVAVKVPSNTAGICGLASDGFVPSAAVTTTPAAGAPPS